MPRILGKPTDQDLAQVDKISDAWSNCPECQRLFYQALEATDHRYESAFKALEASQNFPADNTPIGCFV